MQRVMPDAPPLATAPAADPARRCLLLAGAALPWSAGCAATPRQPAAGLQPAALARLDAALQQAVAGARPPGAAVHVEHAGSTHARAVGQRALVPTPEPASLDTVYDTASLTKAVVTAPLVLQQLEAGALVLDAPVRRWLPECGGGEGITLRHLLTHTSGLPAGLPLAPAWSGAEAALALACSRTPTHAPGAFFRYSDVNFILLGALVERVAGQPLAELARQRLFQPLGMADSGFHPLQWAPAARIAPTELLDGPPGSAEATPLRGQVHDPTARRMGGAAGHAGLFSTVADLARWARMVLGGGALQGRRVLQPASVAALTQPGMPAPPPGQPAPAAVRSLGLDIDSPYSRARGTVYPRGSCGHTGFTGCALWLDLPGQRFHVLLSNRVHPRTGESIVALYEQVATLAALASTPGGALPGTPPAPAPAPTPG